MNILFTTSNNCLYEHIIEYRWFFLLLLSILHISLYVQISVQVSLSGLCPGVTGVTFSVLFQPVIISSVKRAQKVKLPLPLDSASLKETMPST